MLRERRSDTIRELSHAEKRYLVVAKKIQALPSIFMLENVTAGLHESHKRYFVKTLNQLTSAGITLLVMDECPAFVQALCNRYYVGSGRPVQIVEAIKPAIRLIGGTTRDIRPTCSALLPAGAKLKGK